MIISENELVGILKSLEKEDLLKRATSVPVSYPKYDCTDCRYFCMGGGLDNIHCCKKIKHKAAEIFMERYGSDELMEILL